MSFCWVETYTIYNRGFCWSSNACRETTHISFEGTA